MNQFYLKSKLQGKEELDKVHVGINSLVENLDLAQLKSLHSEIIDETEFGIIEKYEKDGFCFASKELIYKNKQVAIKEMNQNEIKALSELKESDFIMKLYKTFETDGSYILILEYLPGGNLFSLFLEDEIYAPNNCKLFIFMQMCIILSILRKKKILHLDIKAENVMVDRFGNLKLIDFGAAVFEEKFSNVKKITATKEYSALEIIEKYADLSYSADTYSVGILFYLMSNCEYLESENIQISSVCEDDLIQKMVKKNPLDRIGHKDVEQIFKHIYFSFMDRKKYENLVVHSPLESIRSRINTDYYQGEDISTRIENFKSNRAALGAKEPMNALTRQIDRELIILEDSKQIHSNFLQTLGEYKIVGSYIKFNYERIAVLKLSQISQFTEEEIEFVACCLVNVLKELRRIFIIHNKICLENLLIDGEGKLILTDFSLAHYNDGTLYFDKPILFDEFYRSPELLIRNPLTYASDVYSAGACLYAMKFEYNKHLRTEKGKLNVKSHIRECTGEFCDLLLHMMEPDCLLRIGRCDLEEILEHSYIKSSKYANFTEGRISSPLLKFVNNETKETRENDAVSMGIQEEIIRESDIIEECMEAERNDTVTKKQEPSDPAEINTEHTLENIIDETQPSGKTSTMEDIGRRLSEYEAPIFPRATFTPVPNICLSSMDEICRPLPK